jgi:NADH:ubiquinone oxidoreductase subunit
MPNIVTALYTWLNGKRIGEDAYGNVYFEARKDRASHGQKKRWVVFKGKAEPSKVPAHWHGWLHYTTDSVPDEKTAQKYAWQKESVPNLTGTAGAYVPPGHINHGGHRSASAADYEAWRP